MKTSARAQIVFLQIRTHCKSIAKSLELGAPVTLVKPGCMPSNSAPHTEERIFILRHIFTAFITAKHTYRAAQRQLMLVIPFRKRPPGLHRFPGQHLWDRHCQPTRTEIREVVTIFHPGSWETPRLFKCGWMLRGRKPGLDHNPIPIARMQRAGSVKPLKATRRT